MILNLNFSRRQESADTYFESFLKSGDTIRVISLGGTVFQSPKRGFSPLVSYIEQSSSIDEVVVLDKVTGNAAALLMKKGVLPRGVFTSWERVGSRTTEDIRHRKAFHENGALYYQSRRERNVSF